jgi:hypothetical protein
MGLFGSENEDGSIGTNLSFIYGLNTFSNNESVELSLHKDDNEINVTSRINRKKPIAHVKLDKISEIQMLSGKEIKEKSDSLAGSAIAEGIIIEHLGAIIGSMKGKENDLDDEHYIIINYRSKNKRKSNGEDKALSFRIIGASVGWEKVFDEIKSNIIGEVQAV